MNLTDEQKNDPNIQKGLERSVGELCFQLYNSTYHDLKEQTGIQFTNDQKELIGSLILTAAWHGAREYSCNEKRLVGIMNNTIRSYVDISADSYGWPVDIKEDVIEQLWKNVQEKFWEVTEHERSDTSDYADFDYAFGHIFGDNVMTGIILFKTYSLMKRSIIEFMQSIHIRKV